MQYIFGLLFVALVCLKLTGLIAISWLWVFAPLFLPLLIGLGLMLFAFLGLCAVAGLSGAKVHVRKTVDKKLVK